MPSPPLPLPTAHILRLRPLVFLILLASLVGCGSQEGISRYSVPKEENTPVAPARDDVSAFDAVNAMAWFFKLTGSQDAVADVESQFTSLMESVEMSSGEPTWTLPEGWSSEPASGMRFATLTVDGTDPPLEVSVIKLPMSGDDRSEYMKQNIDRWRRQLGLAPMEDGDWLSAAQEQNELRTLTANGQEITVVDLNGKTDEIDDARMLGAIILPKALSAAPATRSTARATQPPSSGPTSSSALAFETPEGWETGKASTMRVASFAVTEGDQSLDISAMMAGGDELSNVNRWRGQVGLDNITQEQLDASAKQLNVDGTTGRLFNLVGEEQTIVAVMVPQGGQSWFFKMMGDPALAERELENFEAFVTSVKLP
ncbi:MAG: hypothetical protein KDA93_08240 [Planctomycetaceae bacterium]|nr:hypothetical protein [Planctomycetaceae bacterium]